jgi:hypothetical protein
MKRLYRRMKLNNKGNIIMWVNKESLKLDQKFDSLIDYQFFRDCDSFASIILEIKFFFILR